ncbi:heparinase II/III domain-containing protein [Brachybacterium tyrofermentans]|uniref:heparinase II/III domain-containing protein n=1 Tax=Brachybacterium tyrofermentans TaxID=47848 RepID=UPI003FD10FDC
MTAEWSPGTTTWLPDVVQSLLETRKAVLLWDLLSEIDAVERVSSENLHELLETLRVQGYLHRALAAAKELDHREDPRHHTNEKLVQADLNVLTGDVELAPGPLSKAYAPREGRILKVVGASLPGVDSDRTRRSHRFAQLGSGVGLEIALATPMGQYGPAGYNVDHIDDVPYHRIPGPICGSIHSDEWLKIFTKRLSAVVRKLRPALLIASSDLLNAMASRAVCAEYGIPFVYDVSDPDEANQWQRERDLDARTLNEAHARWGLPEAQILRRERETELMKAADAVVVNGAELEQGRAELGAPADKSFSLETDEESFTPWLKVFAVTGVLDERGVTLAKNEFSAESVTYHLVQAERVPLGKVATFAGPGSPEKIREEGWKHGSHEPVFIIPPFDWVRACQHNRSHAFHLHAWDFMVPFLRAWDRNHDVNDLMWCLERAADWTATFNDGADHSTMAWYDMAIGLRAPRLAYLIQEAVHEGIGAEHLELLAKSIAVHQRAICAFKAFNPRTNHGFYTAVGQLSFASTLAPLEGMDLVQQQGRERLRTVTATQFAADGGHLEHSPDYHRMLVSSFMGAMEDGLLEDPEVAVRIERSLEVMGWFLQPDRRVVQIGDSPARLVTRGDREMGAPHTAFLATGGSQGEPNPAEMLLLKESGYGIVRSPQPQGRDDHLSAGYLTFMGAFHSRTHKHCDDLSITWFDAGHELLIDAGRFGYLDQLSADDPRRDEGFFYGRAERIYVERTQSHNTVQADGREHDRRARTPYGSAIVSGEQHDEIFSMVGHVNHGFWRHRREIVYKPGAWLEVDDQISSEDEKPHDYTVWWNLSSSLSTPEISGDRVSFSLPDGLRLHIAVPGGSTLIPPVAAQEIPLRGWRSTIDYEFTPAWSLGFAVRAKESHAIRTVMTLE